MSMRSDIRVDDDADLVEALRRDDADAAEQLLERYGDSLYRLALRVTGVTEDAEAAAGDALVAAAYRIELFTGESAFGAWIHRMAAAAAYQRLRRRRPSAAAVTLDDVLSSLQDGGHLGPMDDWSDRLDDGARPGELPRVLIDTIDALPADYRTALVLHDVEGMANSDIAAALGMNPGEAKSRVHRARLFLRRRLAQYFEAP
jgi:RNA polymerase sigma-70 factor (ECF subfamily)